MRYDPYGDIFPYRLTGCWTIWPGLGQSYKVVPPSFDLERPDPTLITELPEAYLSRDLLRALPGLDAQNIRVMLRAVHEYGGVNINPNTNGWKSFTTKVR